MEIAIATFMEVAAVHMDLAMFDRVKMLTVVVIIISTVIK